MAEQNKPSQVPKPPIIPKDVETDKRHGGGTPEPPGPPTTKAETKQPSLEKKKRVKIELPDDAPEWAKALANNVRTLERENEMLVEMAGKNKIASWEASQKDHTKKFAYLRTYKNKIVIAWSDLDFSKFNPESRTAIGENLFTTLYFRDGGKESVNFVLYNRQAKQVTVQLLKRGLELSKIKFDDGEELEIPTKFLNP